MKYTYMTALTSERYIPGVIALSRALKDVNSKYPLTILLPSDKCKLLIEKIREFGKSAVSDIRFVTKERILIDAPQLEVEYNYWAETFFKIAAVNCTEFEKIVLLDSDMLVMQNLDNLFETPHMSAVMAGICERPTWTNFNSGMLVLKPSQKEYTRILTCISPAVDRKSREGYNTGDQDVFQEAYPRWYCHKELILPETYNCLYGMLDSVCRAEQCTPRNLKIVHFIGKNKLWDFSGIHVIKLALSILKNQKTLNHFFWKIWIWHKYWRYCQPEM